MRSEPGMQLYRVTPLFYPSQGVQAELSVGRTLAADLAPHLLRLQVSERYAIYGILYARSFGERLTELMRAQTGTPSVLRAAVDYSRAPEAATAIVETHDKLDAAITLLDRDHDGLRVIAAKAISKLLGMSGSATHSMLHNAIPPEDHYTFVPPERPGRAALYVTTASLRASLVWQYPLEYTPAITQ